MHIEATVIRTAHIIACGRRDGAMAADEAREGLFLLSLIGKIRHKTLTVIYFIKRNCDFVNYCQVRYWRLESTLKT